jgi:protocatechuate 3,4-dioxygenase, beta subunit
MHHIGEEVDPLYETIRQELLAERHRTKSLMQKHRIFKHNISVNMKTITAITILFIAYVSGCAQDAKVNEKPESAVGGTCEGCEAALKYGTKQLSSIDTLPDFSDPGPKLEISGTIYERDGKTPAKDVVLYIYHTDQGGIYPKKGTDDGPHGCIRGWIRTNADGKYKFYTLKPGSYPQGGNPAHIHPIIKEPGKKEYWIDEFLFEGDPF